jgi:hypothetical protein
MPAVIMITKYYRRHRKIEDTFFESPENFQKEY